MIEQMAAVFKYVDSLIGRGKPIQEVLSRAVDRFPDVSRTVIDECIRLSLESRVAGVAASRLGDDGVLTDDQIPVIPWIDEPYVYRVLVIHNPGERIWLDIKSLVAIGIKAIRAIVEVTVEAVAGRTESGPVVRAGSNPVVAYPPEPLENVPKGFLDITIRQVMRRS